ncbi:MAG: flagellar filament capping protein FliD [Clostridiales bacterium]|nr:flagellar filament capping protein FliD [Clostridiales bacterium]
MSSIRITGIMSGMDTDQMIKDLMKAESLRLDKVKQDKQYVQWQQESYRDIINQMKGFQSTFFDVLKPSTNLTSASSFSKFSYGITSGGVESSAVSITASATAAKAVTINSIGQLATKDTWTGASTGVRGIETVGLDLTELGTSDLEINISIGSNAKTIKLTNAETTGLDATALAEALNTKIKAAFGADYSNVVSVEGSEVKFDFAGSEIKILEASNPESIAALGITSGVSSYGYKTKGIGELFFNSTGIDLASVKINGSTISLSATDTIDSMNKKLNDAAAGFEIKYNSLSDSFSMFSTKEGSANNVVLDDANTSAFMGKLFNVADPTTVQAGGKNAQLTINDVPVIQSSNSFLLDGITFDLKAKSTDQIDITVAVNTESIVDNIRNFVTEYNKMIDTISTKLTEKRDYDYKPLTDEQRESLSEEEIERWEERAKLGNMRSASELSTFLTQLRNAIIEPISGVGISLNDIGISSSSYQDRGKLTINEDKLKLSLDNNFDEVVNLFSAQSSVNYTDSANRNTRNSENGIGNRFNDILRDYVRTTRDTNGNKGILIIKAGIENDTSVVQNDISKRITTYDTRLESLAEYLASREDYYYNMFSKMESALSQMQSQGDSMMSMLGGGA